MLLVCPVIRDGGSKVDLWGTEYHFKPQPDGCHVAEVTNEKHQDRLLEIGYKIYRGEQAKTVIDEPNPKQKGK